MGTPLNYMMLSNTKTEESNSSLSALSLMRSIGTTIGPMLMIGFIAQAGITAQDTIMNLIPPVLSIQIQADETLVNSVKDDLRTVELNIGLMDDQKAKLLAQTDKLEEENATLQQAADKINVDYSAIKDNPRFQSMLEKMDFEMPDSMETPDFSDVRAMLNTDSGMTASDIEDKLSMLDFNQQNMDIDMTDDELPDDVVQKMSSANVTTIVDNTVYLVYRMFSIYTPDVIEKIQSGIDEGILGIESGIDGMDEAMDGIQSGIDGMTSAQEGISSGIDGITQGLDGMNTGISQMNKAVSGVKSGIAGINQGKADLQQGLEGVTAGIAGMEQGLADLDVQIAAKQQELQKQIDAGALPSVTAPLQGQLAGLNAAKQNLADNLGEAQTKQQQMKAAIDQMNVQISDMNASIRKIRSSKESLNTLIDDMQQEQALMETIKLDIVDTQALMAQMKVLLSESSAKMQDANKGLTELKEAIPDYFDVAKQSYVASIEAQRSDIESAFQGAINGGFQQMYYAVSVFAVIAAAVLVFYRHKKKVKEN